MTVDPLIIALAKRRIELGWQPMKLGRELGWNGGQILQLETGGNPRLSTLRRWADALGCDLALTPKGRSRMTDPQRRRWGKAGQRLDPVDARRAGQQRVLLRQVKERHLDEGYRLWRADGFCPDAATMALDVRKLYGPEVDRACGVEEPTVDLWEAGKLYPTWGQLLALSALVGKTPYLLCTPTLDWRDTTLRFHVPPHRLAEDSAPVMRCELDAIHTATLGAPERRPA